MNQWRNWGLLVVFVQLMSCGRECRDIASEYAAAYDQSLNCDVDDVLACAEGRPVPVFEARAPTLSGDSMRLLGIGTCLHGVSPAMAGRLDSILSAHESAGCAQVRSPACPEVVDSCSSTGVANAGRCMP